MSDELLNRMTEEIARLKSVNEALVDRNTDLIGLLKSTGERSKSLIEVCDVFIDRWKNIEEPEQRDYHLLLPVVSAVKYDIKKIKKEIEE